VGLVVLDSTRRVKFPVWKTLEPSAYIHPYSAQMSDTSGLWTCVFKLRCPKIHVKKGLDFKGGFSQTPHLQC